MCQKIYALSNTSPFWLKAPLRPRALDTDCDFAPINPPLSSAADLSAAWKHYTLRSSSLWSARTFCNGKRWALWPWCWKLTTQPFWDLTPGTEKDVKKIRITCRSHMQNKSIIIRCVLFLSLPILKWFQKMCFLGYALNCCQCRNGVIVFKHPSLPLPSQCGWAGIAKSPKPYQKQSHQANVSRRCIHLLLTY